jgi:hypothetical protein
MMMILSVSVTIPTIKCQNKWWYCHLFWHFIVGMVTDTDSIIIICSDILLLGWWQTLTVSSFVHHHHNNKMSEQMMILSVSVTITTIKCLNKWWCYCQCLSDILLLGWWQTLTVSSSFVLTLYCWDGDRHWQYHHHLFRHLKCPNKWWYCQCLSPSQQ